jgi:ferredoxin
MTDEATYAVPEPVAAEPLTFNPDTCIGCNICVDVCQVDIMIPHPEYGTTAVVFVPARSLEPFR